MEVYIWIITFCVSFVRTLNCKTEPRCKISKIHGMKGADCYDRDIKSFPQCLPSDVEIIDLSYNRIRILSKDDLKKYSNLKMLYLSENGLVSINQEAFQGHELQTLDISINGVTKLPPVVFQLPSLETLYLGHNLNMNIVDAVDKAKESHLTISLIHLDISYVMSEEVNELPKLGVMPLLQKYNISGNKLRSVTTRHFAGLCSLTRLDTTNVSIEYDVNSCVCWTVNKWLKDRGVLFKPFECDANENQCQDEVPFEDLEEHDKCLKKVEELALKAKLMKILIPIGVIAAVIVIGFSYWYIRKRQKQKTIIKKSRGEEQVLYSNLQMNKT